MHRKIDPSLDDGGAGRPPVTGTNRRVHAPLNLAAAIYRSSIPDHFYGVQCQGVHGLRPKPR
jgi:hypothetical protein